MNASGPMLFAALVLGLAPSAIADDDAEAAEARRWQIRTARMEGASVNVQEAAISLRTTAEGIADEGRIRRLSELASDAHELNRRVISAAMAADMLDR